MKYKIITLVSIIVIVVVGSVIYKEKLVDTPEKPVIKIGYILPLSGNVAFLGEGVKNAVLLAVEEAQKKNTKYTYEAVFEDDGFVPARTVSAFQKLVDYDKVQVVVTFASAAGSAVNPLAEKNKIIHFGIASDPNIAKGDYNFINWTPPVEEIGLFVKEAEKRQIKKIAVFGQQISGITEMIKELKKQISGTDIEIVYESVTPFGTKDFRTQVSQLKNSGADYTVLMMFSPELEVLTKQIREAGVKIPLTSIESFELSDNPGMFENLWYVNAADPTSGFTKMYSDKFQKNPSIATPNGYDILGIIVEATESIEKKSLPNTSDIAQALLRINNYNGALGNGLKIDADGLVVSKAVLRIIQDGKSVTIQ